MRKKQKTSVYRRKREGKTNYKKRLKLLVSHRIRLVIRKSLKNIIIQLVKYGEKGDKTQFCVHTKQLAKLGWPFGGRNLPAAYLAGLLCGVKSKEAIKGEVIVDFGLCGSAPKGLLYAAIKGAQDAGLKVSCSPAVLPDKERLTGKHIATYADKLKKENNDLYQRQFSKYLKNNLNPQDIPKKFEEIKHAILKKEESK